MQRKLNFNSIKNECVYFTCNNDSNACLTTIEAFFFRLCCNQRVCVPPIIIRSQRVYMYGKGRPEPTTTRLPRCEPCSYLHNDKHNKTDYINKPMACTLKYASNVNMYLYVHMLEVNSRKTYALLSNK